LTECGYDILEAVNGIEGMTLFEKEQKKIDAVLLDINMPHLSGIEVLKKLIAINPHVKVLMTSGFPKGEQTDRTISEGASGFIPKPFSLEDLSRAIHRVLSGE
jgi:DNA-binding NarL/FixJ family response regulator